MSDFVCFVNCVKVEYIDSNYLIFIFGGVIIVGFDVCVVLLVMI